jgi:hypothetical protein
MLQSLPKLRPVTLAALLIVIGCIRIASTWRTFSDTVDEATHIGAGLELLQYHTYELHPLNPPLPRIVMAAAPLADGMRWPPDGNRFQKIHAIMYGHGKYERNLVLMRVGNLLFFILAGWALFVWARREFGEREALIAVLLFTTQPVILGYSGLATSDVAGTAGVAVALIAFSAWLRRPDVPHTVLLGAGYAFSILMKFTSIAYVPAACAAIYIVRLMGDSERRRERLRALTTLPLVPIAAFAVIWAGYAFTVGKLVDVANFQHEFGLLDHVLLSHLPPSTPLPAPAFFRGIGGLGIGHANVQSYLFGHVSSEGWWWYFPAAVGLKTTLAFFALIVAGAGAAWSSRSRLWTMAEALAGAAAILAVAMPSSVDLGVRYVLPVYVPLTAAAAIGTVALLDSARKKIRIAVMLLVSLHIVASLAAHPDYFPYFNALAGRDPGRYLIDSNLDWGQDLLRLRSTARTLRINSMAVNLGYHDYEALGFPPQHEVKSMHPEKGWIAIGEHVYRFEHANGAWSWLDPFPMTRVGMSIRLYDIPLNVSLDTETQGDEEILLPIAGTAGVVGGPVGTWFRVDQTIRNAGAKRLRVVISSCGAKAAPCELALDPGRTERLASGPGERPYILVTLPRAAAKQIEF